MSQKLTKEELDEQFEEFLKESISDDSVDLGSAKHPSVLDSLGTTVKEPVKTPVASQPWWSEDSEDSVGRGFSLSGKTFRKSLRKSQTIKEKDDGTTIHRHLEEPEEQGAESVRFCRESLEPEESVMASGPELNFTGFGLNTLDEEEEKALFFANLEKGASSTIDYSRLNRELDSTGSTLATTLRRAEEIMTELEQKEKFPESRSSPVSLNYSEDFEDEMSEKEEGKEERNGPAMLEKVSLHDSLDSTGRAEQWRLGQETAEATVRKEEWAGPGNMETTGTAQSHGQSGSSEMEAVQEAYRQITDSMGDSASYPRSTRTPADEQKNSPPALEHSKGALKTTIGTGSGVDTISDLPTAEELLQLIRPELGFSQEFALQPNSETEASQKPPERLLGERSSSAARTVPVISSEDGIGMPTVAKQHEDAGDERARKVMEEVERLMQYKDNSSLQSSPLLSKDLKKQKKSNPPVVKSKRALSAWLPGMSRTSPAAKPPSSLAKRNPVNQRLKKHNPPETSQKEPKSQADTELRVSSELRASLQSTFLKEHTEGTGLCCPARVWSEVKKMSFLESSPSNAAFPSIPQHKSRDAASPEHENGAQDRILVDVQDEHLALEDQEPLHVLSREVEVLKQENYVLQAKLHSLEEAKRKTKWTFGESSDPVTEEKLQLIEKEMREQETIIRGYQEENEKLYKQVKALQVQGKANKEAMFKENQRMQTELATCREQVSRNIVQQVVENVLEPEHNQAMSVLLAQVQTAQKNEVRLMEEIRRLKQDQQALEVDLEIMKKERDLAKAQAIHTSGDKSFEIKMLEECHKEELLAFNKKLQWYAENQELLDRDAARLRAATDEAQRLKEQVEKLKNEINKNGQQQNKVKTRAGDAKRILDLERQVKEMEEILRRRHPNSLPALMLAAAAAESVTPECAGTVSFLERRVQRLEAELEGRDEEAKRSLRAMEQQYHKIKIQYEQQISQLEQQLATKAEQTHAVSPQGVWESKAESLEKELLHLQESHRNRENALLAEITALQGRLQQAQCKERPQKSPSRHERQAEEAQGVRIDRLTQELTAKSKTIQELTRAVERLQKERRSLLLAPPLQGRSGDTKRQGAAARGTPVLQGGEKVGAKCEAVAETFPPTLDEKNYQPSAFSGSHISEVLQENEQLRARLERAELEAEHERATLQAAVAQAEDELRRVQESLAEQLSSLRAAHQRELENVLTCHALEHSSSKVAELTNQLSAQEIMLRHLRDQVKELQGCKEALAVSQVREETLQNEMSKLLEELKEAKEAHSPTLKHFTALERKIKNMEMRHMQRERELQQVIARTWPATDEQQHHKEVEAWRRLAQAKTQELEAFRVELDSILEVLRELQSQNVVLPTPGTARTAAFAQKS